MFILIRADFRHNITIQLTPSRAELNRLQVQMQNGLFRNIRPVVFLLLEWIERVGYD